MKKMFSLEGLLLSLLGILCVADCQTNYQAALNTLDTSITTLSQTVFSNSGQVSQLQSEMNNYATQINACVSQIAQLIKHYNSARMQLEKLDKVNDMWSRNFKLMEMTFKQIKRKVDFVLPMTKDKD